MDGENGKTQILQENKSHFALTCTEKVPDPDEATSIEHRALTNAYRNNPSVWPPWKNEKIQRDTEVSREVNNKGVNWLAC